MQTEKTKLFEEAYAALSDCHQEIKFSDDLTDFEIDRAAKLLNFCHILQSQFDKDPRFSYIYKKRSGKTIKLSEVGKKLKRFTEIDNNNF